MTNPNFGAALTDACVAARLSPAWGLDVEEAGEEIDGDRFTPAEFWKTTRPVPVPEIKPCVFCGQVWKNYIAGCCKERHEQYMKERADGNA